MRPALAINPIASSSRLAVRYASSGGLNPHLAAPSDTRTETIRRALYPPDSNNSYHANHVARVQHLIPDQEVYETIDRAWRLFQRERRGERRRELGYKFKAMQEACDELDRITGGRADGVADAVAGAGVGEAIQGEGRSEAPSGNWSRTLYDRAMAKSSQRGDKVELKDGAKSRKATTESRWLEARIDGLIPREAWVPTETRGQGWNYSWRRPGTGGKE